MKKIQNQKIIKYEAIKIFLYEYYFGYGVYLAIQRLIGGPLILIIGINLYITSTAKASIGYAGFVIFFSIYYILKPFVLVLTQKGWFQNSEVDFNIKPDKFIITTGKSVSELDFSDVVSVKKRKTYFAVKTSTKQSFYLPIKYLEASEIDVLNKLITK